MNKYEATFWKKNFTSGEIEVVGKTTIIDNSEISLTSRVFNYAPNQESRGATKVTFERIYK